MIADFSMDQKAFLKACGAIEAAFKGTPGTHWVTVKFTPGLLTLTGNWGAFVVPTTGQFTASGEVAFGSLRKFVRKHGLKKPRKGILSCILASHVGKLIVANDILTLTLSGL